MFWRIVVALLGGLNLVGTIADIRRGDVKYLRGFDEPIYLDTQPTEFWAFISFKLIVSAIAFAMAFII